MGRSTWRLLLLLLLADNSEGRNFQQRNLWHKVAFFMMPTVQEKVASYLQIFLFIVAVAVIAR